MPKGPWSMVGLTFLALLACKGSGDRADQKCARDGDCAAGQLCEDQACVPASVAERARAADRAAAPAAPAITASPAPLPTATADPGPIPLVPTTPSNPPQGAEWTDGIAVNTQEIHSQPDDCDLRVLREWVQVTCHGPYTGYERMVDFGRKNLDYFESIRPGKMVSFVVRMKPGKTQSIRICAPTKRASLFVNWPAAKDRPVHIALGRGPICEDT